MSIQRFHCFVVSCDICHTVFDEAGDHVIHFDTELEAVNYVADYGWVITETGSPICNRCALVLNCQQDDHAFSDWIPCYCRGRIPDHALFGCGLFRYCRRDGCEQHETSTLAHLPTTDEPSIGC
jgi:hypothetical protein